MNFYVNTPYAARLRWRIAAFVESRLGVGMASRCFRLDSDLRADADADADAGVEKDWLRADYGI
jgi:hypothetical protein